MSHKFLIHNQNDNVGVAVKDITKGEMVTGVVIEDRSKTVEIEAIDDIPIGHKIALSSIKSGELVIKYGVPIGVATRDISIGEHVHTHNLKSRRW
ncbi:MAG: UxaA family hydrolase [bacterium]